MPSADAFRAFFAAPLPPSAAAALTAAAGRAIRDGSAIGDPSVGSRDWRATPAERLHITLRFLGDIPAGGPLRGHLRRALHELESLRDFVAADSDAADLDAAGVPPFPITLGEWQFLPGPRDPRVLAVGVSDPSGTLSRMAAALEASVRALGFPPEEHAFLPHVTLCRRRGRRRRRGSGNPARGVLGPASREGSSNTVRCDNKVRGRTPRSGVLQTMERVMLEQVGPKSIELDRIQLLRSRPGPGGVRYEVEEELLLSCPAGAADGIHYDDS